MAKTSQFIRRLKDGTLKQLNPFTGTEVWTVPERANRPLSNIGSNEVKLIEPTLKEDHCSFCEGRRYETPPEHSRLVLEGGKYKILSHLTIEEVKEGAVEFRRIPNLFEIVSYDYWKENHNHKLSLKRKKWKENYLSKSKGVRHVKDILRYKFRCQGKSEEWIGQHVSSDWESLSDSFFGSSHDLVIANRHYAKNACFQNELSSSGDLTCEQHFWYLDFTLAAIKDIYENNKHVVYTSVFQNWLIQAGASFDHLHKQIVGLDECGVTLNKILKVVDRNPDAYNQFLLNFCIDEGLVVAENKTAVCVVGFGERFPTLIILSKSAKVEPWKMTQAEVRDLSDLLHGCHAAMGQDIPCNEEWFFTPKGAKRNIPWHILLKWRINNPAGFEGNTEIYINTIDPFTLYEQVVADLKKMQISGEVAGFRVGEECASRKNSLKYC